MIFSVFSDTVVSATAAVVFVVVFGRIVFDVGCVVF